MDHIVDLFLLIEANFDLQVGIIRCQQILSRICREAFRKYQLDHIASLGKLGGDYAVFIGD